MEWIKMGLKKKKTKKIKKKRTLGQWLFLLFMTAAAAVGLAIIGYLLIILQGEKLLKENIDQMKMPEATIIYDRDGNEISRMFEENRELVSLQDMPPMLVDAFIATEDKRFYEHTGVDFFAIGRAVFKDIVEGGLVEGGSTITQQLAKNLFLSHDKTFLRKATEVSIATALENNYTKSEILEMYLNRIYLGGGVYGVKAAASHYFDKELDELELWEMATLAGLPKAPSAINPIADPERSKERRAVVLRLMTDQGLITEEQRAQAAEVDYTIPKQSEERHYTSYVDYVIKEAKAVTGLTEEQLYMNGYKITTAINKDAQLAMEEVFSDPSYFPADGAKQIAQGAMVIMDHRDGSIVAMVGGRDYAQRGLNRALVERQPGSAFKPVAVYAPALESGDYDPYSRLKDDRMSFGKYEPRNYDNRYAGEVTMEEAIRVSKNVPAVWLLNEIGIDTGIEFASELGMDLEKDDRNLAVALGGLTRGVSPLEMAQAYSAFAQQGSYQDGYAIVKIEDTNGKLIYEHQSDREQVMAAEHAYQMTEMLQQVVQSGTGKSARMNRPVAGKTGSTQINLEGVSEKANRDLWFVGYTPEWTASVWVGFDITNQDHYILEGSSLSAAIFSAVMSKAMEGMPVQEFEMPAGMETEPEPELVPPSSVSDLSARYDESTQSVQLSWNGEEGNTFMVYRAADDSSEFELLLETASTQVEDFSLGDASSYSYYIVAYNANTELESEPSSVVRVDLPERDENEDEEERREDEEDGEEGEGEEEGDTEGENGEGESGSNNEDKKDKKKRKDENGGNEDGESEGDGGGAAGDGQQDPPSDGSGSGNQPNEDGGAADGNPVDPDYPEQPLPNTNTPETDVLNR
ncbi:transglycosylase domain-containing protein [Marinicrinis sediminis]|uniref:PBP1A family penicillin-binding protein n=1 Tax=Marinicrinis sediminis TaxID=1652465 RepID=A0ABW5REK6_9BACL